MQKFKKKLVKLSLMDKDTTNSDTTAKIKKLPKEKPQKKIVQQKSSSNTSQLRNQIPEETFITQKSGITAGKLVDQIPEETFITQKSGTAAGKLANQVPRETFVTQKPEIAMSVAPLWKRYTERPLPPIPTKYADTDEIPFIDEGIEASDQSTSVYDEIAHINDENHSTKSSIGDSGIYDTSAPDSEILSVDKQNETKSGFSFGINTAVGIKSENELAAHMLPPLFKASRNTGDPFPLSIKPVKNEYNTQTSKTSEEKHTTGRPQNDQESLTLPGGKSSAENEAITKNPTLSKTFDTLYDLEQNKHSKTAYTRDVNSISGREQSKNFAEREIAKVQNQNFLPSADTQKEARTQKSNTFSTNARKEQVGNTPSGIKGFTSTSDNKHEDVESEPIYCEPWDLKPIPGLYKYTHTDSSNSLHKKSANESALSTFQEEGIYESLDDIVRTYRAADSMWFSGEFAEEAPLELYPYKERNDDKSKHAYAQVKRGSPFNSEDDTITADRPAVATSRAHLKEHTVAVSFGETRQKTITDTLLSTRKTVPQEAETHKIVPHKSWFRRILDRITKAFSQGYATLRSIFARSTKNNETHVDQSFSLHNENGKQNEIKEALSQKRPITLGKAGELNEIKGALSQKHLITLGKAGELNEIKGALSQKRPITLGKTGELNEIKGAFSQKRPIALGKTGELSTIRETLSQKRPAALGKTGELSTIRETLSQKRPAALGKTGELSTIWEALSKKPLLLQDNAAKLGNTKEALSEKGFGTHLTNDAQNKGQDNLYKDRYAFSTCTEHDKIKSILTRESGITDKLRESGMKEEQNKTCVPSLGCNSHSRNQASRAL
ncbi:hypothetical protein [Neorickettsia sp. 179522]|uniref:hypothetical protein n=1 Tax=Neorickettsia sp. 179522 TaxID=1714371 RepID=UPI000797B78D|nr:hypothetical protein [Neorickettsia sp. 179522]KYH12248.1 hypothetical protein AS219_00205 [Neorickettsia sp. 179522]